MSVGLSVWVMNEGSGYEAWDLQKIPLDPSLIRLGLRCTQTLVSLCGLPACGQCERVRRPVSECGHGE